MSQNFEIGDMIKFKRSIFSHWGVYVGDGDVVHLKKKKNEKGQDIFVVASEDLKSVAKGKFIDKDSEKSSDQKTAYSANNYLETPAGAFFFSNMPPTPRSKEEIKNYAKSLVGQIWDYNLLIANCECFAIWLRYRTYNIGSQGKIARFMISLFLPPLHFMSYYFDKFCESFGRAMAESRLLQREFCESAVISASKKYEQLMKFQSALF